RRAGGNWAVTAYRSMRQVLVYIGSDVPQALLIQQVGVQLGHRGVRVLDVAEGRPPVALLPEYAQFMPRNEFAIGAVASGKDLFVHLTAPAHWRVSRGAPGQRHHDDTGYAECAKRITRNVTGGEGEVLFAAGLVSDHTARQRATCLRFVD